MIPQHRDIEGLSRHSLPSHGGDPNPNPNPNPDCRQLDEGIAVWQGSCVLNSSRECQQAIILKGGKYHEAWEKNDKAMLQKAIAVCKKLFTEPLRKANATPPEYENPAAFRAEVDVAMKGN